MGANSGITTTRVKSTQFVRLSVVALTGSTKAIASFGTQMDFSVVSAEEPKIANVHEDITYVTEKMTGGDTVKSVENNDAYIASTGVSVPLSDNADSIKFSIGISYSDYLTLKAVWKDTTKRITVCVGYGRVAAAPQANPGFHFIIGKPLGDLIFTGGEVIGTVEIEIAGGEAYSVGVGGAVTDYNTAMEGIVAFINPNTTDITVPAIPAGSTGLEEYDELLAGKIVNVATG